VLREHELRAQSETVSHVVSGKEIRGYNTLIVKPWVYPVNVGPSTYNEKTMTITALSPLDAYGLESIGKAKVIKRWS
jgi:hypothetical protein